MKILIQVYTATVRPHMEYATNAWSSAARTKLDQQTQTPNAGLRNITGGMKTTPSQGGGRGGDSWPPVVRGKEGEKKQTLVTK